MISRRRQWLIAALLLGTVAPASAAQTGGSTTVIPVQALTFGLLVPGMPEVVSVNDIARRAVVALSGSSQVDVSFVLPAALESSEGRVIPLRFGSSDAGILPYAASLAFPINPLETSRVALTAERAVHLVLGGTALPARGQQPGHYSARVLVLISQPGT